MNTSMTGFNKHAKPAQHSFVASCPGVQCAFGAFCRLIKKDRGIPPGKIRSPNKMLNARMVVLPLDLLPNITDQLAQAHAFRTLASFCQLDRRTCHLVTPKLYHLICLSTPLPLGTFLAIFGTSTNRHSHTLSLVHHLDIELDDSFLNRPIFRTSLGQPFGSRQTDVKLPQDGLFPNLETLHLVTSSASARLSIRIGDEPSIPVLVARLLTLAQAKHLRWRHSEMESSIALENSVLSESTTAMERAARLISARHALRCRRHRGAISEEVPESLSDGSDCASLEFLRINVGMVDERWEKAFRCGLKREKKLVIYVDCSASGNVLSGGLGILRGLSRDGTIYLVEERGAGFENGHEWRDWVGTREWQAFSP